MANDAGTHSYYSGTQGDLQVEMGLYGALIVVPKLTRAAASPTDYAKAARTRPTPALRQVQRSR